MQKTISSQIRFWPPIFWIVTLGLFLRILFILKGGALYYGKPDFWIIGGDTYAWFDSFLNLYKHGIYTHDLTVENGKFFRPPGYALIMGSVYLICGKQFQLMETVLMWLQTILDVSSIYLVYRIAVQSFANKLFGNIAASLYACYPFIIVWVPVLYAESTSVFFLLLSLYFFMKEFTIRSCFISALFLGLASLIRLQCIPVFGVFAIVILLKGSAHIKTRLKYISAFTLAFCISYGLWPMRNYFLQHRLVFTQDLNVGGNWSQDYLSMINYLYTIQVDVQPQRDQIIRMQKVTWPSVAKIDKNDAYLLDSLSELCRRCGTGFSFFRAHAGLTAHTVSQNNKCDSLIEAGFNYLALKQKEINKWHYYLTLPLGNLKKALFKSSLYGNKSVTVKLIAFLLFGIRTLLIFFGIAGIFIGWRKNILNRKILLTILLYCFFWYFYMSFVFRQMEIRYLLHADILLLFPAAYIIYLIIESTSHKMKFNQKSGRD